MNIKEEEIFTKLDKNIRAIKELLVVAILLTALLLMDLFFFNGKYIVISNNRDIQQAEQSTQAQVVYDNSTTQPVIQEDNNKVAPTQPLSVVFENKKGVKLNAEFTNGQVMINAKRLDLSDKKLVQTIAADGARYLSDDGLLELWNKGDEVTLRESGEVVFLGKEVK